jgi:transposase InsO family protein
LGNQDDAAYRDKAHRQGSICRALDISRSGLHHALQHRDRPVCDLRTETLFKAVFAEHQQIYGSRRMRYALAKRGLALGRYKVRKLLKAFDLKTCWKRKFVHTTDSRHTLPVAENLLNSKFHPEVLNQAWASDITYICTRIGWLYLCTQIEPANTPVRNPGAAEETQDGVQHEPERKRRGKPAERCFASRRREGAARHNAPMERFFLNLTMERVWRRDYANQEEACRDVADYLMAFYHQKRLNSALGNMSPAEFERQYRLKPAPVQA